MLMDGKLRVAAKRLRAASVPLRHPDMGSHEINIYYWKHTVWKYMESNKGISL